MLPSRLRRVSFTLVGLAIAMTFGVDLTAQRGRGGGPPRPAGNPKEAATIDITGYWVSIVSEDWLSRMLLPPRGDYAGVPLNQEGRRVANQWDPATMANDGCRPYGAPGLMRVPGRLHITWEDDSTLKIDTDAGQQTRYLRFSTPGSARTAPSPRPVQRSWQGTSAAMWEEFLQRGGAGAGGVALAPPPPRLGSLKVVTTNLRSGFLRRNGVPYSDDAVLTEHFDRLAEDGTDWLVIQTVVDDPRYLTQEFVTSTHFMREPDGAKWSPSPCETARASR